MDDDKRQLPDWDNVERVHVLGICGSAMGSLAALMKTRGLEVRGSDLAPYPPMSDRLAEWGIPVYEGYDAAHLAWGPQAVVVGNVIRRVNPEATEMRARGLPHASFPETLRSWFMEGRHRITVAGTHGKTTTTSLTAWLLSHAGRAPGFLIGGIARNFGRSFDGGTGPEFVVEADEYDTAYFDKRPKFVHYDPITAILTSVEFDHADIYRDLDHVRSAFVDYAQRVAPEGRLIVCADDPIAMECARATRATVVTYGIEAPDCNWRAFAVEGYRGGVRFVLMIDGKPVGEISSPLTGHHNALNTLAAMAAASGCGVPLSTLVEGLARFEGVVKRQEVKGEVGGVTVVDDYAHHPTAVRETVASMRQRYSGRRLWALFEAESNTSRRKIFQDAYWRALRYADLVVLSKPLKKNDALSEEDQIDVAEIVRELERRGVWAWHIAEFDEIAEFVAAKAKPGDVILAMSGRDFGGVHAKILRNLERRFGSHSG
jgi:UDP-N-acetylmuramate: L-alanyl-gamma-D-glutamyl-meso-diaminopimelate ligase